MTVVFEDNESEVAPTVLQPTTSGFTHVTTVARPSDKQIVGHVLLILVLALIGAQVGYFSANMMEEKFRAESEVEYRGTSWTETQDVAIRSRTLTGPVADQFGIPIEEFEDDLGAGLVPGTQILRISYDDADAELALEIVTVMTDRYVESASELPSPDGRQAVEANLAELRDELATAEAELAALPDDLLTGALTVEQSAKQSEIAAIRESINVLELRLLDDDLEELAIRSTGVPRVTTDPFLFEDPVEPQPMRLLLVGAAAGIIIGGAVMAWRWSRVAWRSRREAPGLR